MRLPFINISRFFFLLFLVQLQTEMEFILHGQFADDFSSRLSSQYLSNFMEFIYYALQRTMHAMAAIAVCVCVT